MRTDYNYYEILEIKESASPEIVKAAYRALAKKYHPDSYKGSRTDRENKMSQINQAYEILSDQKKRRDYDLKLRSEKEQKKHTENSENNPYASDTMNEWRKEYKPDNSACDGYDRYEEEERGSRLARFFQGVKKEIVKTMQENEREKENAYLEGISTDDYTLVRCFKQAKGFKRVGYAKALEEKGLLERNYDGKLVPTYRFKELF